jgi:anti-anti-sigma factor
MTGLPALLVVDAANVVGSVPDGWWRDRATATTRLRDALVSTTGAGVSGGPGQVGLAPPVQVVLVVEGRARAVPGVPGVQVISAPGSGDDAIVELIRAEVHRRTCAVVTADRGLRARLAGLPVLLLGPHRIPRTAGSVPARPQAAHERSHRRGGGDAPGRRGDGPDRRGASGATGPRPDYHDDVAVAELTVKSRGDRDNVILALHGEIDVSTVGSLRTAVEQALQDKPGRVVLDFGGVTFCDSQGLSTLITLSRQANAARVALVLTDLGEFLQRLMDITGLRPMFTIEGATGEHH